MRGEFSAPRLLPTGCVFTTATPAVSSVTVSPSTATVTAGQGVKLTATVATTGFANKAVYWAVDSTSEIASLAGLL